MTLTVESSGSQIELVEPYSEPEETPLVSAIVVAEFALELDNAVERLAALGSLSLADCRRAAFAIIGEDIAEQQTRELLRSMYSPRSLSVEIPSRMNLLDGGKGDGYESRA